MEPLLINEMSRDIERAAVKGTGVLITDHYHQYLIRLVDTEYVMWKKQCDPLGGEMSISDELEKIGYVNSWYHR